MRNKFLCMKKEAKVGEREEDGNININKKKSV